MLSISQSIDEFATDSNSLGQSNNRLSNKSSISGRSRQYPIQLTLPHFASIQCHEISTPQIGRGLPKRKPGKGRAQQVLSGQHQLSFQFLCSSPSVGAEK